MYDFPVRDCPSGTKRSPYFSSIVRQFRWPSLPRKIEIQKSCYLGYVTSHFSEQRRKKSWRRKSWRWLPHRLSKRHVTVNNNIPIEDYVHPNDQTQSTFEMTLGYKPFTELELLSTLMWLLVYCNSRSCFVQQRLRIQSCVLREKKQFVFSNFVLHHILGDPYYNDKLIIWIRLLDFSLGI